MEENQQDDAEEEEEDETDYYHADYLDPSSLRIVYSIADDAMSGRLSKHIWQRARGQENLHFTPIEEILFYIKYFAAPKLRQLLSENRHERQYVWVGTLCSYHRLDDVEETCERWSSLRNERFISPHSHQPQEIDAFIDDLLEKFLEQSLQDVDDMANFIGSSWIYDHIK